MVTFSAADRLTLTRILKGKDHNKDHNEKVIITSTELCNEQQFSDFVEELGSCRFEAESIIDQVKTIQIHWQGQHFHNTCVLPGASRRICGL